MKIDDVKKVLEKNLYKAGVYHKDLKPTMIIVGELEEALTSALEYLSLYEEMEQEVTRRERGLYLN